MMDIEVMRGEVKEKLTPKRYLHCIRVEDTAVKMAGIYGENIEKARIAGLLHDITKDKKGDLQLQMCEKFGIILTDVEKNTPSILHAISGAYYIKFYFKIEDMDIINAVRYHSTARQGMTTLEKIIYLSDIIEPSRNFNGLEKVRSIAFSDIDEAMIEALKLSINEIIGKRSLLQIDTVMCYNELIKRKVIKK